MMLKGLSNTQHDFVIQALTSANNVLLKDGSGVPSMMVRIPMFLMSDVISGAPSTPHPMFIINGDVKSEIYVGKYLSTICGGIPQSLHGRVPDNNISFADAVKATAKKGDGWHVLTNAEFSGLALLAKARGTIPRGNTANGYSYAKTIESGILSDDAKNSTTGTKYDSGYLYDMYNVVSDGTTNNVYRCMGDKVMPLYDWVVLRTIKQVIAGKGQLAYVMVAGTGQTTIDVFNKDNITTTYTVPDATATCMALDANDNIWVACESGALYEVTSSGVALVTSLFTTAETIGMSICFDGSGNLWVSASNNGGLYKYTLSTKTITTITGYAGITKIAYHPAGYIYATLATDKTVRRISLTDGSTVNTFTLTFTPRELVIDLSGNAYVAAIAGTSQNIAKIDVYLVQSYITVSELDYVNNISVTVTNRLQLTGANASGVVNVVTYNADALYSKYTIGYAAADTPVVSIGNLFGDPNGVIQFKTFGISSDRYHLNQMFTYALGSSNVRLYPYNADTIHIIINGDSTFTGTYNHIEFDISGSAFTKLYFSVTSTDINVKANDVNSGNLLADLATLTYSVTGDNITNTDGIVISNVVKSKLTIATGAVVSVTAMVSKLKSYSNADLVTATPTSGTTYSVNNSKQMKIRLKTKDIVAETDFTKTYDYSTPTLMFNKSTNYMSLLSQQLPPCVIKESDTSYKMWFSGSDGTNTRVLYSTSTDGINWSIPVLAVNIGTNAAGYNSVASQIPYVIKESATSYKMWFTGYDGTNCRLLYSTSTNGVNWTAPILTMNIGTYATADVSTCCVIEESSTSYKLWFSGHNSGSSNWYTMYATSTDGVNWGTPTLAINYGTTTYSSQQFGQPRVIKESSTSYKMWATGYDGTNFRILYSTSTDGITWTTPVLAINIASGTAYSTTLFYPSVIKESATSYKMWFEAFDGTVSRLYYATSTDGITWSNIRTSIDYPTSKYYSTHVAESCLINDNGIYKMWFAGSDGTNFRILYTYSTDMVTWTIPVLAMNVGGSTYNTNSSHAPTVIKESSNSYKMWFCGVGSTYGQILYSTSTNGTVWTTPVLAVPFAASGSGTYNYLTGTAVVRESSTSYKMWVTASNLTDGLNRIYYCTSSDGITWTTPTLVIDVTASSYCAKGASDLAVIKESDSLYRMWFSGSDSIFSWNILYCTSTDGKTWTTPVKVINKGSNGVYDTTYICYPKVIKNSDTNYTFLTTGSDDTNYRILKSTLYLRTVIGDTIEANIDASEITSMVPTLLKDSTGDCTLPTLCYTHSTYSGITESLGYQCPSVIKESVTLYKTWVVNKGSSISTCGIMYMTSLDGKNWTGTPTQLTLGNSSTIGYSCPSVVKRNDGSYLMMLCGSVLATDGSVFSGIYYATSTDGIVWTTPTKVLSLPSGFKTFDGLKVILSNGKYQLWALVFSSDGTVYSTMYYESTDIVTWSTPINIVIDGNGYTGLGGGNSITPARLSDGRYVAIITDNSSGITHTRICISLSMDGINWSIPRLLITYNNTTYDTNRLTIGDFMIDGNTIKLWVDGTNGSYYSVMYTERTLDQVITSETSDTVLKVKRHLRVPKYMYGISNTVLNHDIIKYNGTYYLFFTKNTGSGYKIQMTTSTDMKTWTTASDVALPGFDTTYAYGCSSPSVVRAGGYFEIYFQVFDSALGGSVIYQTYSADTTSWTTPTKVLGINVVTDCAKYVAKPSVVYDGTTYKMWFLGHDGTNLTIQYSTSTDGITWAASTRALLLGVIGTAKLFNGTMYICANKKALSTGYRLFYSDGVNNMYTDTTDGTTLGTPAVSYKYPMDLFGYGGAASFRILTDDTDTKMIFLSFDASGNAYIVYRDYDESSSDFAEATSITTTVLSDAWHDQKFLPSGYGDSAGDPCIIKVGINSYMGWFTYNPSSGTGASVYLANSTDGINWTNFTKCWDTSTKADALLTTTIRKINVIKDGSTYKMWVSTMPTSTSAGYEIVYMTSTDGATWSAATATTLGTGASNIAASIIKDGSTYKAWIFTIGLINGTIDYYESSDGITWTVVKTSAVKCSDISVSCNLLFVDNVYKMGNEYVMYVQASISGTVTPYRLKSADGKTWTGYCAVTFPTKSSYGNKAVSIASPFVFQETGKYVAIYSVSPNTNINCAEYCAIYSEDGLTFGKTHNSSATINAITVTKANNLSSTNTAEFETVTRSSFYNFAVGDRFRVDYKGDKEVLFAANATKIKLEAFGASGATEGSYIGGKGGYVYGSLDTSTRKKLIAVIGSKGGYDNNLYGYNGGGTILDSTGKYYHGGGATDIRTSSGDLYRRLLVAGGGGSADASDGTTTSGHAGGNGGGWTGIDGVGTNIGKGGTQSNGGTTTLTNLSGWSAGIFGTGAKNKITTSDVATLYGAGGGGYYGAGNGSQGAGGGSSYAAGNANCPTAHPEALALTDTGTSSGTNTGNGYATITILKIDGSDGSKRTINGSGPITWNDTMDINGVSDLVGNLNEMVTGLKISAKSFYVIKDNDAAMSSKDVSPTSTDWKMVDANGNYIASGTGIAVNYSADFSSVDFSALALTGNPYLAKALGIAPLDTTTTGLGYVNGGISSEFFPIRGGYYNSGNTAGIFNLSLISKYTDTMPYTGFRVAYYKP